MKTFKEYIESWFLDFLCESIEKDEDLFYKMFVELGYKEEDIPEGESYYETLVRMDGEQIYKYVLCSPIEAVEDLAPRSDYFLRDMFKECLEHDVCENYSFVDELLEDMSDHAQYYSNPLGFFQDLSRGGCQSGMIGMFIYHDDCLNFYKQHMVDMHSFKEDLEEEMGDLHNNTGAPFFDYICWLTYEELAYRIGRTLFPEDL